MRISFVIPAYNEAQNLEPLISRIRATVNELKQVQKWEVIVVDDHSSDSTMEVLEGLGIEQVKAIRLNVRSGSHTAIRAGLRNANGDHALCLCADGQEDPSKLREMLAKAQAGANTVWGVRRVRNDAFYIRWPAQLFYKLLHWTVSIEMSADRVGSIDYYLLDRTVIDAINGRNDKRTSLFGLIMWLDLPHSTVLYDRRERHSGPSKWSFLGRIELAMDWVLAFSNLPHRLITLCGVILALLGLWLQYGLVVGSLQSASVPTAVGLIAVPQVALVALLWLYGKRLMQVSSTAPLYSIERSTFEAI